MLRNAVYSKVEPLLNKTALSLAKRKFTPNQLTLLGLGLNFLAGWIYSNGLFFLGGIFVLLASLGDLLDGPLARTTGKASRFGAFLDSTVDRYSDFFLFGGVALHFAVQASWGWCILSMGIVLGAFMTSYSKARAECLIPACSVGVFERAERILALAAGSLVWPLFPWVLVILFVGTHATALQRIFYVKKILSSIPPSAER